MAPDLVSLSGSLGLIDELYARFLEDPESVEPSWRQLFRSGALPEMAGRTNGAAARRGNGEAAQAIAEMEPVRSVWPLVNAYRARGHLHARLDPLGLLERPQQAELDPATYGFGPEDLDTVVDTAGLYGMPQRAPLRDVVAALEATYGGCIGLEYLHISTPAKKRWLAQRMETMHAKGPPPREVRIGMLEKLIAAETFERFIHTKYPGTKRFSVEGAESLMPMLDEVLEHLGRLGALEVVVGMAHRGRLNVLVQTMNRQARDLFAEFDDVEPESTLGAGDVKYHLGYSTDRHLRSSGGRDGSTLHVSLAYNPSHLEAVDPVVVGRVRAKQRRHGDWERRRAAGVLIHGDAAFAGQGLVAETLQLSSLHGYRTGGTVHLIVNNQIGFTATATEYRSTAYCTDVAKMIQCPIWHVNGEDLDAVARVVEMAMEYRARFKSDVVIDMFCYRKFGHNEMDEPSFTNPVMYRRIQQKEAIAAIYAEQLIDEGLLHAGEVEAMRDKWRDHYESELAAARERGTRPSIPTMGGVWAGFQGGLDANEPDVDTGVDGERLREIAERSTAIPEDMTPHRKVQKLLGERAEMGRGGRPIDWGMAEILAYGSLLWEGYSVRLSGQDSARGTFSHRHALITDVDSGTEYMLLGHLHPDQGECRIYDSPLSEAGVLGFEFGYSLDYPDGLVMWEAQFGDFANGAQVIIDQFIVSSEDKWNRLSGLVLLLPHGYEGQGPEHSSARIERFLQLAAEDNIQICQPSTPAQVFHLLRRQVVRPYRKPLIAITPKSLLRHPMAVSARAELERGIFQRVIGDPLFEAKKAAKKAKRVLMCSGRVYYDLVAEREKRGLEDQVAIIRLEQLYPWRPDILEGVLAPLSSARDVVWVQDEPANMGAATFLLPRLSPMVGADRLRLVSRPESASPATGSSKAHAIEQRAILDQAFQGDR